MSGLELLGMFFCILLGMGVFLIVVWVIGSTWRHSDEIQTLEVKVRYVEDALREQKTKRKTR
jgi:uncharacterized membrane protein YqjE